MIYRFILYSVLFLAILGSGGCHQVQAPGSSDTESQTSTDTHSETATPVHTSDDTATAITDTVTDSATGEYTDIDTDTATAVDTGPDTLPGGPCESVPPSLCDLRSDCLTITAGPVDSENKCFGNDEPVECLDWDDAPQCSIDTRILAVDENGQCWYFICQHASFLLTFLPALHYMDTMGNGWTDTELQVNTCGVWAPLLDPCQ